MIREPEFKTRQGQRQPVRILLIEDDPQFAELLQAQLRRLPEVEARLEAVGTLAEARERLASQPFGLVFADLNLPDSKGLATITALSPGERPVIVITGDPDPALRAAALDCGAYDFLSKDRLTAAALERLVRLAAIQANTFRSLRDSEERFRSLVVLSSDWYWEQDEELRFTYFEGGASGRADHPAKVAIGKRRWELDGVVPVSGTWEEHRALLDARQVFRGFEYAVNSASGATRYHSASGEPMFDVAGRFRGYRGIASDITARRHAEEELRRFRVAMDTSPDMILLIDVDSMRHIDVNTTTCNLLGYSREELLAMGPPDILPLSSAELRELYRAMVANPAGVTGMRSHYRCKDGSQLPFESTRRVMRSGEGWIIAVISRDMRPRLAVENAQRESEERFRSLTALSSDWYWEQDREFRLTFMSSIEKTGLDAASYLGKKRWDQPALNLSEADWARHRAQLERHEPFRDFEIERGSAGGESVWMSLSGEPLFDAEARFAGYRGIGRDITARKRGEREVLRLGRMYRALGAANEAILRAKSQQEAFERACEIAVEAGEFVLGAVFLLDAQSDSLSRSAASGNAVALSEQSAPSADASKPGGQGMIGEACRSGRPVISNDYEADWQRRRRHGPKRSYAVGSAAVFPLKVGDALAGVFTLQHARRNAFTEELTALLQRLADNIAFALESFRREQVRRRAKRKLGESEQRFRSLTGLSSDMYWEQDTEYRFITFTGAAHDRIRTGRDGMIGRQRWEQSYFNMNEEAWAAHRADLDARRAFRDLELGRVNEAGEKVWVSVSGEPVFDQAGVFRGYRGVGRDITLRRRDAQLRELEHSVTRSLAATNDATEALRGAILAVCEAEGWECGRYFIPDDQGGVLRMKAAWGVDDEVVQRFIAGSSGVTYAPGEGLAGRVWQTGQALWVSNVSEDARSAQPALTRASGMRGAFVFPVVAEGKTVGVLGFNSRAPRQAEEALLQAIGVIGSQIGQFVQRKQAEEVMRASEARFRSLTRLSSDWYWEQDAEFRFVKFEGRSLGAERHAPGDAVLGRRVWEFEGLVRESVDLDAHRTQLERHESFRGLEYAYQDRAGRRFYIRVDGEPIFDDDGRFAGYRGTSRDVTQQRRDADDLRRFRAAMDMSLDAISLIDRGTMRFVDVNEAACRGAGLTREEFLRKGPHEVLQTSKEELERTYDTLIAEGGTGQRSETRYRLRDGRRGWTELHRRALRTGDGWIIVSIAHDITERKRAEERQAVLLHYQERIARFGQSALVRREPAELIEEAVQAVLETLAADAVAYLEPEPTHGKVVVRALVGLAVGSAGPFDVSVGPLQEVLRSGTRALVEGGALPFAWARSLHGAALVAVRGDDGVRGVICVAYRQAHEFVAEELNFIEAAASVLSTGLQRVDSEGRLAYLAQFDGLTGLPNRALLADRFSQMIVQARRHGSQLGVLFVDLDEFKMVNDTLGHAAGDQLLKEVAVRLQSAVRQGDTVARISGDEFALVLADLKKPEDAALVAQKVIERLAAAVEIGGQETFVTASVGIASFPGDGGDAEALIGAADAAMYRAKQSGRNAFQFFTAEIDQRLRARAQMGTDLRRALEREEFTLAYQPKFDLATRRPKGAEALLRWQHPERGPVSPAEFIPVMEETGLIVQVGEWVLQRACEDLREWQADGVEVGAVAVNLSARQFRQQDLDRRLKRIVAAAGVAPALIELEVTESQMMQDPDQAVRVLRSLCDAGMRIAIDDFGTGYSSLSYLTRFPPGALKIDRSFVKNMFDDKGHGTIVRIVIEMAHTLGFTVVAEGVETEEQANLLRLLRCDLAQGFLFARPMPAAALAGVFKTSLAKS